MKLDDIHIGMLDLLRKNGRLSIAALAKQLDISRSSAYQRYEALIEAGVITGFTATLDFGATGLDISALVFVSIEQNRWQEFRERLPGVAELEYFAVTTGQHDGMLLVRAPNVSAVHHLVTAELASWPSIKATETVFLLDEQWDRVEIGASFANAAALAKSEIGEGADSDRTDGMTRFIRTRGEAIRMAADEE